MFHRPDGFPVFETIGIINFPAASSVVSAKEIFVIFSKQASGNLTEADLNNLAVHVIIINPT